MCRQQPGLGKGEKRSLHSSGAGLSSGCKDVMAAAPAALERPDWVNWAGAISRDILPPRLVPLAVVTVILKRQHQLHPLYPRPACGPQEINVTFEKRLR